MRYVNQLQYPHMLYTTKTEMEGEAREKGRTTTIKSSGCGLCSAIMVADRLLVNYDFDLDDAIQLAYDVAANHKAGTNYKRFAPAFAEKLGLRLEMTADLERLLYCLRTGGAAVVHVREEDGKIGLFTHGGHYVAVIGEEPDGRVAVLDPSYKEGKYEEEGRKGKVEMKNGVIALCAPETLDEDAAHSRDVFYYLFWRK